MKSMMMTRLAPVPFLFAAMTALAVPVLPLSATEIGYAEAFALADDRDEVLKQLIPGTEDHYYYHALHHQNEGRLDEVDKLLEPWIKRHKRTHRVREIQHRQALLRYGRNPRESADYVRREMGLSFNHQQQIPGKKPDLPNALDPKAIARATLLADAFAQSKNLSGLTDAALEWLVRDEVELTPARRRHLLQRLKRPDFSQLVDHIAADLATKESRGFGEFAIHRALTLKQMKALLEKRPELVRREAFIHAWVGKLQPGADIDWRGNPAEKLAYLNRLWAFVKDLDPVFNSLKAHVLYGLLEEHRARGEHPKPLFDAYLALPRRGSHVREKAYAQVKDSGHFCDFGKNFSNVTGLRLAQDDMGIIRRYLLHYFVEEKSYDPYTKVLADTWVKPVFAEAKIVNGVGDQEKWYALLSPSAYQALKDRVDIDFAPANPHTFAPADAVSLLVDVKNVRNLIVKVYEINALSYYLDHGKAVNTDLNLDGLVANHRTEHAYDEGPLRRVRRKYDFPALNGKRGVWIIELIGNGRSSRALIRKGGLQYLARTTSAGTHFTVLDDANRPVMDPAVWLGGRKHTPNDRGHIIVPFSTNPGRTPVVLTDGDFAALEFFHHPGESYRFDAGFHVPRESLLPRKTATVAIRPSLRVNGEPVSLSVVEDVRLSITSTDVQGVQSTTEALGVALFDDREATHEFRVPEGVTQLAFQLSAKVRNVSEAKTQTVSAAKTFSLNGIHASHTVEAPHFGSTPDGYVVDLLGKTGEPRTEHAVNVELKHRDFTRTVKRSLKTDSAGRILLGKLEGIEWVRAAAPAGPQAQWHLPNDRSSRARNLHVKAGEAIAVPYMGAAKKPERTRFALLEVRGTYVADHFPALSLADGFLRIKGLPAGDYALSLKEENHDITIRVTDGEADGRFLLSRHRHLEVVHPAPLQVSEVATDKENITIQLANVEDGLTRVHVMATRFVPEYAPYDHLRLPGAAEPSLVTRGENTNRYLSGRDIGDEYRYILARRTATIFPGNMLSRPGLLLNPWELRSTETGIDNARRGEEWKQSEEDRKSAPSKQAPAASEPQSEAAPARHFVSLDFLRHAAPVAVNLAPDKNGRIVIPLADLDDRHHLHVVAVDPYATVYRQHVLPERELARRDLRLLNGLDPSKHLTELDRTTILRKGAHKKIDDVRSAKLETYDSVAAAYRLLATLSGDATLAEFRFILDWPALKPEEKREKYSKYACHELNFFLSRRDPEFFEAVVLPYIANKKDRTFLDEYLLGTDLTGWLDPWKFGRLNAVERILLARRVGGGTAASVARHIRELEELIPVNPERDKLVFETAFAGFALDAEDSGGEAGATRNALYKKRALMERLKEAEQAKAMPESIASADDPFAAPGEDAGPMLRRKKSEGLATRSRGRGLARLAAERGGRLAGEADVAEEKTVDRLSRARFAYDAADLGRLGELRDGQRSWFRKLGATREWAENNYYHIPIERQNADLVTVNAFWKAFAAHAGDGLFLSADFPQASRNFTEMMFALSVLGLPFEPGGHGIEGEDTALTFTAGSPAILFHREIRDAEITDDKAPILVSQNFYRHGDRYRSVGNERVDKFVTDEFLTGVVYGCEVVVTNPTSSNQKLDTLVQVPHHAIPVGSVRYTGGSHLRLEPYNTTKFDFFFYFPAKSKQNVPFPHYPVHVAKDEKIIAWADKFAFNVVDQLSRIDKASWDYVSQMGTPDEVIAYLGANNLNRLNLDRMAWRMKDPRFFERAIALLEGRHHYQHTLYSYGLYHAATAPARQYLNHSDRFLAQCGSFLDCELVSIDPIERRSYQHLEYRPLVNARAHQLGGRRKILNNYLNAQYHRLMDILCHRKEFDDEENMVITYYLLLQDRIEEGLKFFSRVSPDRIPTRLQYDYFQCCIAFYEENPQLARRVSAGYLDYPVDRWKNLFAQVDSQAREIAGEESQVHDEESREEQQDVLADTEPSFQFEVENREVTLTYRNLETATVNYYRMDLEFLFSSNPFVGSDSSRFSIVKPNKTALLKLPKKEGERRFALPEEFHSSNVLVEIVAAGQKQAAAYYANTLNVQFVDAYGRVEVRHAGNGKPLPKTYVKVYARYPDGQTKFYKDGYTDLRGKFDYVSLNTDEIERVQKFSVLVMNPDNGALVRETEPPKR